MEFRDFLNENISETDILGMYHNKEKMRDISVRTGKSIAEIYRIIHRHGRPNRVGSNHHNVHYFADSGMPINKIAEFTKYSPRNVRYILNKRK